MKNTTRMQGRRPMPLMRPKLKGATTRKAMTLGDLVTAAYDALGDSRQVVRVLQSNAMSHQIGRRLVFQ